MRAALSNFSFKNPFSYPSYYTIHKPLASAHCWHQSFPPIMKHNVIWTNQNTNIYLWPPTSPMMKSPAFASTVYVLWLSWWSKSTFTLLTCQKSQMNKLVRSQKLQSIQVLKGDYWIPRTLRCSCPHGCGTCPCLDTDWILTLCTLPPGTDQGWLRGTGQGVPRGTGLGSLRGTARCTAGQGPRCLILWRAPLPPPGGATGGSAGRVGGKILLYLRLYFGLMT